MRRLSRPCWRSLGRLCSVAGGVAAPSAKPTSNETIGDTSDNKGAQTKLPTQPKATEQNARAKALKEHWWIASTGESAAVGEFTIDEVYEAVKRVAGTAVVPEPLGSSLLDPRWDAIAVFKRYMEDANTLKSFQLNISDCRVPIAVTSGARGSGMTHQLRLLCEHFAKTHCGAQSLYFTCGGEGQSFDAECNPNARVAHRMLHAAARSTVQLHDFCKSFRTELSMAPCGTPWSSISGAESLRERWLTNPSFLIAVCRRLLGVPTAPLLVAADDMQKLGKGCEVGERRCPADGLWFLYRLSQRSFIEWRLPLPNEPDNVPKPMYIVASNFSAVDHTRYGPKSNSSMYYLPIPPLDLSCGWDKEICRLADQRHDMSRTERDEARAAGRRTLRLLHHKPSCFSECYSKLVSTHPKEWKALHAQYKSAAAGSYKSAAQSFFDCCAKKGIDPWNLVQHVFWPTSCDNSGYDSDSSAALVAECLGLCTILRTNSEAAIYVHPLALQELLAVGSNVLTFDKTVLALVEKLCQLLLELPAAASASQTSKKHVEKIMTLFVVCRVATSRQPTMQFEDLFPRNSCDEFFSTFLCRVALPEEPSIAAFPAPCSAIPAGPFYSILTDNFNPVVDAVVSVMLSSDGKPGALIGLHVTESSQAPTIDVALQRNSRAQHFNGERVYAALEERVFIHVLVTPNDVDEDSDDATTQPLCWQLSNGTQCFEALLTHRDVKQWCPMIGYSGFDLHADEATSQTMK